MSYSRNFKRKAFSFFELILVSLILGLLSFAGFSFYQKFERAQKIQAAISDLTRIGQAQITHFANHKTFLPLGPTNVPPSPFARKVDFFSDPEWNWHRLPFSLNEPIFFGYLSYPLGKGVVIEAIGDLDGTGRPSIYSFYLGEDANGRAFRSGLFIFEDPH
jgi:type II secretory pathway pseudopilin PulG